MLQTLASSNEQDEAVHALKHPIRLRSKQRCVCAKIQTITTH